MLLLLRCKTDISSSLLSPRKFCSSSGNIRCIQVLNISVKKFKLESLELPSKIFSKFSKGSYLRFQNFELAAHG